ncbi:hypothetical protein LPC08_22310 [Roseomonas sp. OT10]|uniref:hypothetical protein n=1 Tax=Roseomonas cutis TaxID=2897332 RepID=UPI001E2CE8EA|nr:hypothetical protein [Roseomonas sp. OT10]UFN48711.1 hypothetical protein LPC08_22310 [Roseomonas sp. OT10]
MFLHEPVPAPQRRSRTELRITTALDRTTLPETGLRPGSVFFVDACVRNITARTIPITLWRQEAWAWLSDNSQVQPIVSEEGRVPYERLLRPGHSHHARVAMLLYKESGAWPLSFRLGFACKYQDEETDGQRWGRLYWGNRLLLESPEAERLVAPAPSRAGRAPVPQGLPRASPDRFVWRHGATGLT